MTADNEHAPHGASHAHDLGIDTSATGVQRPRLVPVSAVFEDRQAVDRALPQLTGAGVPRDLIEVVVSPEAARRFYAGVRPASVRQTVRYAGIGGLVGLIMSVLLSLVMISLPEFVAPGVTAVVQLLGPNMGAVGGAALGALAGYFRQRPAKRRHARAGEAPHAVIVVVRARDAAHVDAVQQLLKTAGGREPRVDVG